MSIGDAGEVSQSRSRHKDRRRSSRTRGTGRRAESQKVQTRPRQLGQSAGQAENTSKHWGLWAELDRMINDQERNAQCQPHPGGPKNTALERASMKSRAPRWATTSFLTLRWCSKSKSSKVLRAGKRADAMR